MRYMYAKFIGGFIMCGPFATLVAYLSEFHGNNFRSRIMMLIGVMFSLSAIIMPILALLILPINWSLNIFNMNFAAWHLFLAICGIPSLLSGICFCFLPESPRFLISQGRNREALEILKNIYGINRRKPNNAYPIKELIKEIKQKDDIANQIGVATIEANLKDLCNKEKHQCDNNNVEDVTLMDKRPNTFKLLCSKQYLGPCLVVCMFQFFVLLGQNTMRLWLPQMFASLNEYEQLSSESTSMCTILEYSVNKTGLVKDSFDECVVIITPSSYTNNIIVACICFVIYIVAGTLINFLGNKKIQVIGLTAAGTCGVVLYWSSSSLTTLIITSLYLALGSMSGTSSLGSSVNLFPTSMRTMILSLMIMIARIGTILGNVLFPIFMSLGCVPPLAMIAGVMYLGCLFAVIFPNADKA
ncbi:uncharacterized protein [Musca autumnalis]|uniref:uncharacterized protein n=1 Tax=Musca autumnalis TaxID=221902 RepID=UPI003CFA1F03